MMVCLLNLALIIRQAAARQFDDAEPFIIRPATSSDIDALLALEAESWWAESRASKDSILAIIGEDSEGPGSDVFLIETQPGAEAEATKHILGALYTQFVESEASIHDARDVHTCATIRSPWEGRVLQLLRVNTRINTQQFGLIAAGAILRDFALEYAAALGDVSIVCAVTRCSEYPLEGGDDDHLRAYVLRHQPSPQDQDHLQGSSASAGLKYLFHRSLTCDHVMLMLLMTSWYASAAICVHMGLYVKVYHTR